MYLKKRICLRNSYVGGFILDALKLLGIYNSFISAGLKKNKKINENLQDRERGGIYCYFSQKINIY